MTVDTGNDETRWQYIERVVMLLERAISPNAVVEHNVMLPVIGRPGVRQCDVVITFNKGPRQSIAIVEVQARNTRPEINEFHGWYMKMQEVGAQLLICVSEKGYPQSIINEVALRIGPTVRLMTLTEITESSKLTNELNITMHPQLIRRTPRFGYKSIGPMRIDSTSNNNLDSSQPFKPTNKDRIFSYDDIDETPKLTIDELVSQVLQGTMPTYFRQQGVPEPDQYSVELCFPPKNKVLWFHYEEHRYQIREWKVVVEITVESLSEAIPAKQYTYRQQSEDATIAWLSTAEMDVGNGLEEFQIVFSPDATGLLQITAIRRKSASQ